MTTQPTVEDFDEMLRLNQIVYGLADALKSQRQVGSPVVLTTPIENLLNVYSEQLQALSVKVKDSVGEKETGKKDK